MSYNWEVDDILITRRPIKADNGQTIPVGSVIRILKRYKGYHIHTIGHYTAGTASVPNITEYFRAITCEEWIYLLSEPIEETTMPESNLITPIAEDRANAV